MLWGRNDQSVTANSSTVVETSNGAPIGTWTAVKGDQNGAPHTTNAHFGNTSPGSRANVDVRMFNNATPSAFINGMSIGVFGVSATEMKNNRANNSVERPAHAGWVIRRAGTGPIVSIAVTNTAPMTGYVNGELLTIVPAAPGVNATATITAAAGIVTGVTLNRAGSGFTTKTVSGANVVYSGAGTGAVFTATAGGRAGRIHTETLVAMHSLGAQTNQAAAALVNDAAGGTDNPYYPGV